MNEVTVCTRSGVTAMFLALSIIIVTLSFGADGTRGMQAESSDAHQKVQAYLRTCCFPYRYLLSISCYQYKAIFKNHTVSCVLNFMNCATIDFLMFVCK